MSTVTQEPTPTGHRPDAATLRPTPGDGFAPGRVAGRDRRPRLHPAQLHPVHGRRRRSWPGRPTRTTALWRRLTAMFPEERGKRRLRRRRRTPRRRSPSHAPGYIDRDNELIVGLQTDAPLKRAIMPNGGWRMVEDGLTDLRLRARPERRGDLHQVPQDPQRRRLRRLHRRRSAAARRSHIITGLPDAYGRGRIIGDYRRVALYGVDRADRGQAGRAGRAGRASARTEDVIRDREELAEQIRALGELKADGRRRYGYDISGPAAHRAARPCSGCTSPTWPPSRSRTARRCRWAAPRRSSTSTCSATSPRAGSTEAQAQELIDDFVIKLRIVRFLRTPEYDAAVLRRPDLGDRVASAAWATDGRPLVTRTSLPLPADPVQPGPGARAEPDRAVVAARCPRGSSGSARRSRSTPAPSSTRPTT